MRIQRCGERTKHYRCWCRGSSSGRAAGIRTSLDPQTETPLHERLQSRLLGVSSEHINRRIYLEVYLTSRILPSILWSRVCRSLAADIPLDL